MTSTDAAGFVWVNSTGHDSVGQLHANKRKVRQQVRKHVGDQWKTSRKQSLQIRQVIVPPSCAATGRKNSDSGLPWRSRGSSRASSLGDSLESPHALALQRDAEEEEIPRDELPVIVCERSLTRLQPTATAYEASRAQYNFDLSWLSGLTISHVGSMRSTSEGLNPWLGHREQSFLDLLPLHYGQSRLLKCVVDLLLAKAAYHIAPSSKTENRSLRTYGLALKEVTTGLSNEKVAKSTEMLCAIRMLQMYELLEATTIPPEQSESPEPLRRSSYSSSEDEAEAIADVEPHDTWLVTGTQRIGSHYQGMQNVIQMREPSSFTSEMDKTLLCSLLGGFWLRCYINNTDFFLEEVQWLELVRSIGREDEVVRHPITLDLWLTLAPLPRLLRQTNDCIQFYDLSLRRVRLQQELQSLYTQLSGWVKMMDSRKTELHATEAMYQELLGFGLGTLAIACRMLVALDPMSLGALQLEAEAQALCQRTFTLRLGHIVSSGFFVGVCCWATVEQWQEAIEQATSNGDRLLDKEVWARWNGMMGRKPHSERRGVPWRKEVDDVVRSFLEEKPGDVPANSSTYSGLVWFF